MKRLLIAAAILFSGTATFAQAYTAKVSKDSLKILNTKIEVLKQNIKVLELKVKEADEESDVEKLRLKMLEANGDAKVSSAKSDKITGLEDKDKIIKIAKTAKRDASDAQKALDKYTKQIAKVEDLRAEITSEERKLTYKKPVIVYDYK